MKQHAHGKAMAKTVGDNVMLISTGNSKSDINDKKWLTEISFQHITIIMRFRGGNMTNGTYFIWWFITKNATSYFSKYFSLRALSQIEWEEFEQADEMLTAFDDMNMNNNFSYIRASRSQIAVLL